MKAVILATLKAGSEHLATNLIEQEKLPLDAQEREVKRPQSPTPADKSRRGLTGPVEAELRVHLEEDASLQLIPRASDAFYSSLLHFKQISLK
jgi:hypothetical protein